MNYSLHTLWKDSQSLFPIRLHSPNPQFLRLPLPLCPGILLASCILLVALAMAPFACVLIDLEGAVVLNTSVSNTTKD